MVTESRTGPGIEGAQSGTSATKPDSLDKELGSDKVKDVLGDYFQESDAAIKALICENPGLCESPKSRPR